MATYLRLLNDDSKIWSNLIAVITKVGWSNDYEDIDEWTKEMDEWKDALLKEFNKRYDGAEPTVLVISQDLTKPKRKENILGTEQNNLMLEKMKRLYMLSANNLAE